MTTPKLSHSLVDPKNPEGEPLGRLYSRTPGGTPEVPSITTVIGALNPQMEWWRGLCAAKEGIRLSELITKRKQESAGDRDWRTKEREISDYLSNTSVRDMNLASQRGDVVHDYAEKVCRSMLGEEYDIPAERAIALEQIHAMHREANAPLEIDPQGYFQSVHNFMDDFKVKPVTAEATVWNSTVGYAGTNDLLCEIDGRLTLLDWKTKKKIKFPGERWYRMSIKPTIALQLEAARRGEEMYDEQADEWVEWKGANAIEQVGVALGPNGYEAVRVHQREDTWETFQALLTAWHWDIADKTNQNPHLGDLPMNADNIWG